MGVHAGPAAMALLFVFIVGTALLLALLTWSVTVPPAEPGGHAGADPGSSEGRASVE
jgi:hypothetical protein